jgi:hypothetical protein
VVINIYGDKSQVVTADASCRNEYSDYIAGYNLAENKLEYNQQYFAKQNKEFLKGISNA